MNVLEILHDDSIAIDAFEAEGGALADGPHIQTREEENNDQ